MKVIFIAIIVLIALLDFGLFVACSHMESKDQYKRMRGEDDDI